jgi:hypothetical protein
MSAFVILIIDELFVLIPKLKKSRVLRLCSRWWKITQSR